MRLGAQVRTCRRCSTSLARIMLQPEGCLGLREHPDDHTSVRGMAHPAYCMRIRGLTRSRANDRTEPLAIVNIPVISRRSESIGLRIVDVIQTDIGDMDEPAYGAELPISFRALWLHTSHICVEVAGHSLGAAPPEADEFDAAEELCRFLDLAPACYEELRLYTDAEFPMLTLRAVYLSPQDTIMHCVEQCFDNMQAVAAALRRFADDYDMAVSMSEAGTFLSVVRSDLG